MPRSRQSASTSSTVAIPASSSSVVAAHHKRRARVDSPACGSHNRPSPAEGRVRRERSNGMADVSLPGEVPGSIDRTGADRASMYDVTAREDVHLLHGKAIGIWGVLFLTVTGAAPISAMLFNTPISVGFGNGIGTPAGFYIATVILTIFSVGYIEMSRRVTAAGGFYSFISHGLGREMGMAAGLCSVVAYSVFEASLCGGFAFFANAKVNEWGWNVPWPWFAFGMVALIAVLAYFDIRISATILGIALIGEIFILLVMDIAIFGQGGENVQGAGLNPLNSFKDYPGTAEL